jgi:hypothetical protein
VNLIVVRHGSHEIKIVYYHHSMAQQRESVDIMIAYVLQIIQSRVTDGKCPKNYPPLHVDSATVAIVIWRCVQA